MKGKEHVISEWSPRQFKSQKLEPSIATPMGSSLTHLAGELGGSRTTTITATPNSNHALSISLRSISNLKQLAYSSNSVSVLTTTATTATTTPPPSAMLSPTPASAATVAQLSAGVKRLLFVSRRSSSEQKRRAHSQLEQQLYYNDQQHQQSLQKKAELSLLHLPHKETPVESSLCISVHEPTPIEQQPPSSSTRLAKQAASTSASDTVSVMRIDSIGDACDVNANKSRSLISFSLSSRVASASFSTNNREQPRQMSQQHSYQHQVANLAHSNASVSANRLDAARIKPTLLSSVSSSTDCGVRVGSPLNSMNTLAATAASRAASRATSRATSTATATTLNLMSSSRQSSLSTAVLVKLIGKSKKSLLMTHGAGSSSQMSISRSSLKRKQQQQRQQQQPYEYSVAYDSSQQNSFELNDSQPINATAVVGGVATSTASAGLDMIKQATDNSSISKFSLFLKTVSIPIIYLNK
jgi:hypothetical protein